MRPLIGAKETPSLDRSNMSTDLSPSGNEVLKRAEELDAILPFDRRDQLAELLTDDDVATLKHLAREGMGDNTMRALASDLAYLEAWCSLAAGTPSPGPRPRAFS